MFINLFKVLSVNIVLSRYGNIKDLFIYLFAFFINASMSDVLENPEDFHITVGSCLYLIASTSNSYFRHKLWWRCKHTLSRRFLNSF